MKRRWRLLLGALPLAFLVILALALGTPLGSRLTLMTVDRLLPMIELKYQGGTLNQGVALSAFRLDLDTVVVEVDEFEAQWRLHCLFKARVCAKQLRADGIRVFVELSDEPDPDEPPKPPTPEGQYSGINLPLVIEANWADLGNIDVRVDDMRFEVTHLAGEVYLADTLLRVSQAELSKANILIPLAEDEPTDTQVAEEPESDSWAMANLPKVTLPFELVLDDVTLRQTHLQIGDLDQRIALLSTIGRWHHTELALPQLELEHNWASAQGHLNLAFEQGYLIDAALVGTLGQLPWLPPSDPLPFTLRAEQSLADLRFALKTEGAQQAEALGQLTLGDPDLPYRLWLHGDQLQWPLQGEAQWRASDLELASEGSLSHQKTAGSAQLQVPNIGEAAVNLVAVHEPGRFQLYQGDLSGDFGDAQLSGVLEYHDGLAWHAAIDTQGVDLSPLLPEAPLKLHGDLISDGHWKDDSWHFAVKNADVEGEWMDYPLKIDGNAEFHSDWRGEADNLTVLLNGAVLALDGGIIDGQWQLSGQIASQDLGLWHSELEGQAQGSIQVSGAAEDPKLQLKLDSESLAFDQLGLGNLSLDADYQPRSDHGYRLELALKQIQWADSELGLLRLQSRGNLTEQSLSLSSEGPALSTRLMLSGQYDRERQRWDGLWQEGIIQGRHHRWQMEANTSLQLELAQLQGVMAAHCWRGADSQLCFNGPSLLGPKGALALAIDLDTETLLRPWLPDRMLPDSSIRGDLHLNWQPGQTPRLLLSLEDRDGELTLLRGAGLPRGQLNWQSVTLDLALDPSGVELTSRAQIDDRRSLDLELQLGSEAPYPLSGQLSGEALELAPYLAWFSQLKEASGLLDGDVEFAGTLREPEITGLLTLRDGVVRTVINPTEVDDINLSLDFQGQQALLDGQMRMGEGTARVQGEIDWRDTVLARLGLVGERLSVLYPPLLVLEAKPDLTLELSPERLRIGGELAFTSGSLTLESLPEGAVDISEDVVYVDSRSEEVPLISRYTEMDVRVILSNNISVRALGVTGDLGGDLNLRLRPGQPLQIFGDLALQRGRFRAFGQRLEIDRGQITFNGPANLPNLDIAASRTIDADDVTAGVRVTGTPASPQLSLFSTPYLEQQEILSYLTRGQGLSASDGSGALATSAALAYGVSSTGGVVTTIGEGLGFKNVSLDAEGAGDDTQITISGYIGERLFLKYGVGVFESISELTVRLDLIPKVWLEAVSAITDTTEQSLDLFYAFEID
ncbi:autotransporter assembly complex protein TamB [Ferrimonas marina]|uniref:Autotransporter secretion inner membrane protein TamB n=1 Tax=Ferrimonas marina TaxID=299255 RepID=A0A1M5YVY4_9GAMM|nr:translocation/assembly module TamB domain-containing protein [Ferrimonas marina]SHI15703.1 autotransporter secretion inner membrane protein TamB [Ferrimonas marina]